MSHRHQRSHRWKPGLERRGCSGRRLVRLAHHVRHPRPWSLRMSRRQSGALVHGQCPRDHCALCRRRSVRTTLSFSFSRSRNLSNVETPCQEAALTFKPDRKSTRLNSSHVEISYAVFCLKKKKKKNNHLLLTKKNKNKNNIIN